MSIDFERARAEHRQLSDHLAEVIAALDRIDKGTYGVCEQCGSPIGQEPRSRPNGNTMRHLQGRHP